MSATNSKSARNKDHPTKVIKPRIPCDWDPMVQDPCKYCMYGFKEVLRSTAVVGMMQSKWINKAFYVTSVPQAWALCTLRVPVKMGRIIGKLVIKGFHEYGSAAGGAMSRTLESVGARVAVNEREREKAFISWFGNAIDLE